MSSKSYPDVLYKKPTQFYNGWPIKLHADKTFSLVNKFITNSSTRESLKEKGYPVIGEIETTIRNYQSSEKTLYQQSLSAMETSCGNCQEMAYLGALILRYGGYEGDINIGLFGINHVFLIIGNFESQPEESYIVDTWAGAYFPFLSWKENLKGYGGSIREGIMKGRILDSNHFDLEDEEPESINSVGSIDDILPEEIDKMRLHTLLCKKNKATTEEVDKKSLQVI